MCLELAKGKYHFMGMWDTDEFLVVPSKRPLKVHACLGCSSRHPAACLHAACSISD